MNGICETILAGSGGWFQILVAVAVMVIYGLGGLAKIRRGQEEPEEEGHEPQRPGDRPQQAPRYKPIDDQPTTHRTTSQRARTLPYARDAGAGEPVGLGPQQRRPAQRPLPRPQTLQQPAPARADRPASQPPPPVPQPQYGQRQHRRPIPVGQAEHTQVRPATSRPAVKKVRRPKPAAPIQKASQPAPVIPIEALSIASLRDPDNLKMAIVFAEILGKPIALRDQLPGPIF